MRPVMAMPRREADFDKYWGSYRVLAENEPAIIDRVELQPGERYALDVPGDVTYNVYGGRVAFASPHPSFPHRRIAPKDKQTVPGSVEHEIVAEHHAYLVAVAKGVDEATIERLRFSVTAAGRLSAKEIRVSEGAKLSMQFHEFRPEAYFGLEGAGYVIKGGDSLFPDEVGEERMRKLQGVHRSGGLERELERTVLRAGQGPIVIRPREIHYTGSDEPGGLTFLEIVPNDPRGMGLFDGMSGEFRFVEEDNYRVSDLYADFRSEVGS